MSDPSTETTAALTDAGVKNMLAMLHTETEGEFEIEREIGRGGMAVVYLAREVHLKRHVAIKVLPPELTFGAGATERFQREAQTAAALDHPNIIPIYRISKSGELFWYAMKFVQGESLEDVLKQRGQLELDEARRILGQVAEALDWAHRRDVVHRDIKPANIMIDEVGRAIVTDFGIAKALANTSLTQSGAAIGTPFYMSPEQCMGKPITGAADQYAVGVMAYQMLAGRVPFEAESAVELLHKHCFIEPPPLEEARPGLPASAYASVDRALAKKPEDRHPSVRHFIAAWDDTEDVTLAATEERSGQWDRASTAEIKPEPRRRRWGGVAAAVAVIGALAAGGVWLAGVWPPQERTAAGSGEPAPAAAVSDDSAASTEVSGQVSDPQESREESPAAAEPTAPPRTTPAAAPRMGQLTLVDVPSEATVLVDGVEREGQTVDLAPGWHDIVVLAAGFQRYSRSVEISAGTPLSVIVSLTPEEIADPDQIRAPAAREEPPTSAADERPGVLEIQVIGGAARIFVDSVLAREGRSHRAEVTAGSHSIRLERPGWATVDTSVSVPAGDTLTVRLTLRRGTA